MKENIFVQNPKKSITLIVLIFVLIIDISVANLYKLFSGHSFFEITPMIEKSYRIPSNVYHHDLAKNTRVNNAVWGDRKYTVSTDSLGFKSAQPQNTPLIPTGYRIVFIGDSFTEGIGVNYEDTFVGQIKDEVSKDDIDVLNAAVASYSPIIYFRKIKYLLDKGLRFDELFVFIDISDIQDEMINYGMSSNNTVIMKETPGLWLTLKIRNNSILFYSILNMVYDFLFQNDFDDNNPESVINLQRSLWTIDDSIFNKYGKEGLEKASSNMDKLVETLKKYDTKLTIAVYPWPDQIIHKDLHSIQVTFWTAWAERHKVNILNYFPCFIGNTQQNGFETINQYFINGDFHWNEKGHQLIADEFISSYKGEKGQCIEKTDF